MSIKALNPYLFFNGTAAKAIALYERALGAQVESLQHYRDVPGQACTAESGERVMHALLRLGGHQLMASDTPLGREAPAAGTNHVCLDFTEEAELRAAFDALAEGGTVEMPPHDTFWGATFASLTDAYGISWLLNHTQPR